jgi:hypothetical protein
MKGFLDAIFAQYSWAVWSDDETIIVEYFDSVSEKYKPVANDEELMIMFEHSNPSKGSGEAKGREAQEWCRA